MKKLFCVILSFILVSGVMPAVYAENSTEILAEEAADLYIDESVKNKVSEIAEVEIIELNEPLDVQFEIRPSEDIKLFSAEKSFFDYGSDWGYEDLDIRSNPTGRKAFYNELLTINKAFVSDMSDVPSITHGGNEYYVIGQINGAECNNITYSEASETFISFRQDHPEYYWIPYSISAYRENDIYYIEIFKDYARGSVRSEFNTAIQNEFEGYMETIDGYTNVFEKSLILYDKIIDSVEYGYDEYGNPLDNNYPYAHNIVGVLDGSDETDPVCESYAKAYQLLLNAAGVENVYVVGGTAGGAHAWNYIRTEDGHWHPADATWDDIYEHERLMNFFAANNGAEFGELPDGGDNRILEYSWGGGSHVPYNTIYNDEFQYAVPELDKARYIFTEKPAKLLDLIAYEKKDDGTLVITDAHNAYGVVEIPDTIDGMQVTSIGEGAFEYTHLAYSYTVPVSVTSIGNRAFAQGGGGLLSVLNSIKFLGPITECGYEVLSLCEAMQSVELADGTTMIGTNMFERCKSLEEITIPDSVTQIDNYAFNTCSSLKSIHIGKNVKKIADNVFDNCTSLKTLTVSSENPYYTVTDDVLFTKDMKTLVYCTNKEEYSIPESVENFCGGAFSENKSIKKLIIPNGITELPAYLFEGCSSLTDVEIPDSVINVGDGIFANCTALEDIILPKSLDYISADMFSGCNGLTEITIPSKISYVSNRAFSECKNLKTVNIEEGVVSIGWYAFSRCYSLKNINLPDSLVYIGPGAFAEIHSSLESIELPPNIHQITNSMFDNCQGLKEVTIPEGVTEIDEWAFNACIKLDTINLPDGITKIGDYAFYGCTSLPNVRMPDNLEYIGKWAFQGACVAEELILPDGLTFIGDHAFEGCGDITSVVIPSRITTVGFQTFYGCINMASLSLPQGLKIIENGAFDFCTKLEEVKIPYGTQKIGANAFAHCEHIYTEKVEVEDEENGEVIEEIEIKKKLNKIIIPSTVTEIGEHAFLSDYKYRSDVHEDITIYGYSGTAAEKYAQEDVMTFYAIDEHPPVINSSNVNRTGDTNIFSVNISDIPIECPMYAALYSNGELVGIKSVILDKEVYAGEVTIEASKTADTAKIFIWDGLYPLALSIPTIN